MRTRAIIVHGWDGYPEEGWFPWLKQELRQRAYDVHVPHMPGADAPDIDTWVGHLTNLVGTPDAQTFFVGHSIGCQAILRYLATLSSDQMVGGAVFVAGFFTLTNMEDDTVQAVAAPWLTRSIDYQKVLSVCPRITAIFSDNDRYVPLENAHMFAERLHAKIILQTKQGHFSGSVGMTELPVVLDEILLMDGARNFCP